MNGVALAANSLAVGYKSGRTSRHTILQDVNLKLNLSEFACMLGPNGAGKSTLLRTFGNMQPPFAGSVEIGGRNIDRLSNHVLAKLLSVVLTERLTVGTSHVIRTCGPGALSVYRLVRRTDARGSQDNQVGHTGDPVRRSGSARRLRVE